LAICIVVCNTTDTPSPLETLSVNSSLSSSSISSSTTNKSSSLPQDEDHPKAELHKGSIFNGDSFLKSTTFTTAVKTEEEPPPIPEEENHGISLNESIHQVADFNLTSSNLTANEAEDLSASTNSTNQLEDRIELDPAYAVDYGNLRETQATSSTSESPLSSSSSSTTTTHVPASSGEWCASKENTMECVALTKNFKMLTTFHTGRLANTILNVYR